MGTHYSHLSLEERRKIAKWRDAKMPISEMADRLGRDASTIYRDLRRNHFDDKELPELNGYYALNAQHMYERLSVVLAQIKTEHSELRPVLQLFARLQALDTTMQVATASLLLYVAEHQDRAGGLTTRDVANGLNLSPAAASRNSYYWSSGVPKANQCGVQSPMAPQN